MTFMEMAIAVDTQFATSMRAQKSKSKPNKYAHKHVTLININETI